MPLVVLAANWQILLGRLLLRVSCYVYNSKADVDRLAAAVEALASASSL